MYFHSTVVKLLAIITILLLSSTFITTTALSAPLAAEQEFVLSEAELAQTLAPIALYPDTLLTHILIASTYPIEVVEAERWLNKHSQLTAVQVQKKAQKKDWDASIKALLSFPRVITKLSEDLTWMQKLGDAFLQDEARVLASIQTLRQQADQAGSLANMDNVEVIKEQEIIIIEPAQPEVIYVPYYDTRVVYGRWHWSHYPPVYWHRPHSYAGHYSPFYWSLGVRISSHFYFSAFHWHNRHVVVNHFTRAGYHPRKKIVTSHRAKRWNHQPKHRRGVAYSSGRLKQKYYGSRPSVRSTNMYKSNAHEYKNKAIKHNKVLRRANVSKPKVRNANQSKHYKNRLAAKNSHQQVKQSAQSKQVRRTSAKRQASHNHRVSRPSPKSSVKQPVRQSSRHSSTSTRHQQSKERIK